MIPNPQSLEQLVEIVLLQHIVVVMQHRDGQALSEPARTDEEKELVRVLDFLNESRLVNVIAVVAAYVDEIHHPVGNALAVLACVRVYHNVLFLLQPTKI